MPKSLHIIEKTPAEGIIKTPTAHKSTSHPHDPELLNPPTDPLPYDYPRENHTYNPKSPLSLLYPRITLLTHREAEYHPPHSSPHSSTLPSFPLHDPRCLNLEYIEFDL